MAKTAMIRCDISNGLRPSEALAAFKDYKGKTHYLRVERDFLIKDNEGYSLPVGIVEIGKKFTLVEFSHEAETGANRIWLPNDKIQ